MTAPHRSWTRPQVPSFVGLALVHLRNCSKASSFHSSLLLGLSVSIEVLLNPASQRAAASTVPTGKRA